MTEHNPEHDATCGHPNHGGADHDCKPFLPCADPACPCGPNPEHDALRWHLNPPCGHARCKGYTSCRVARSLTESGPESGAVADGLSWVIASGIASRFNAVDERESQPDPEDRALAAYIVGSAWFTALTTRIRADAIEELAVEAEAFPDDEDDSGGALAEWLRDRAIRPGSDGGGSDV